MAELIGRHRYQVDAKGRIPLPSKLRDAFQDGVYLTLGQDGCLYAFPREEWVRRREEVQSRPLGGQRARDYSRMFFSNADRVELDGQGRLVIPQGLRSRVGLEREVVVLGVADRLEIWSGPVWDTYERGREGAYVEGTLAPEDP